MELISYATFKKRYWGTPEENGFKFCGDDCGYGLFKSCYPKDVAKVIIDSTFVGKNIEDCIFVYVPHYYRGVNSLQDRIEVYYKKKKK